MVVGKLTQQSGGGASYCYRCDGTDHNHTKCGFKTSRCHFCKKLGHIAAACHQRKGGTRKPWSGQGKRVKTLGGAEEDPESAGADLGGGLDPVRPSPLLIRLTCIQESLETLSITAEFLLTDFFVNLKLASDIQIVHTSKQIMSFVIIIIFYLCTCTNNSNRSTWSIIDVDQRYQPVFLFTVVFSGISELLVCVLIDQDHPGSG